MKDINEIWVPIKGYEGKYEISSLGNVKSLKRDIYRGSSGIQHLPERMLKLTKFKNGYCHVSLCNGDSVKKHTIHSLVALHFIENLLELSEVNHKNGIRTDNRANNLEWCSRSENIKHSYRELNRKIGWLTGKVGKNHPRSRPIKCEVLEMNFESCRDASNKLGVSEDYICKAAKGKITHIQGLTFRYI